MNKKIISLMLVAIMICSFAFGHVPTYGAKSNKQNVSVAKVWDGTADTSWFTTEEGTWNIADKDVYNISTAEELAGLAALANKKDDVSRPFKGVVINLTNDIVLNDTSDWENWLENPPANEWRPIGEKGGAAYGYKPFIGTFNGNGHTISGMYINDRELAGLFGYLEDGAQVYNLKIEKSVIVDGSRNGFIAANSHASNIANCEVKDCLVSAHWAAGGIVGTSDCYIKGLNALSQLLVAAAFGLVFNPVLTGGYFDNIPQGANVIYNCKVSNCRFLLANGNIEPPCGGIFCEPSEEDLILNNVVENLEMESKDTDPLTKRERGKNVGFVTSNCKGKQELCYAVNCKRTDGSEEIIDKEIVNVISKKTASSEKFAKKMGGGFAYNAGSTPEISTIKDANIKVALSGKKAIIDWKPVEGATKYKVYYTYKGKKTTVTTKTPSVVLENLKKGGEYSVMIKAFYSGKKSKKIYGGTFKFKV